MYLREPIVVVLGHTQTGARWTTARLPCLTR